MAYNFTAVCLSDDYFRKLLLLILEVQIHYHTSGISPGIRVKFIYKDHQVKVQSIGAKMVKQFYSRNIKLRSAIIAVL